MNVLTKQDLQQVICEYVGEIISDALEVIVDRFDGLHEDLHEADRRLDIANGQSDEIHIRLDRLETKIDELLYGKNH